MGVGFRPARASALTNFNNQLNHPQPLAGLVTTEIDMDVESFSVLFLPESQQETKSIVDLDQDLDPKVAYQYINGRTTRVIRLVIDRMVDKYDWISATDVHAVVGDRTHITFITGGPALKHAPRSLRSVLKANSSALLANVRHQRKEI